MYAWRAHTSTNPVQQQRYVKEAEFALKQAFAFCPYSPETVFNLASLLASTGRYEDAYLVASTCYEFDTDNLGVRDLVRQRNVYRWAAQMLLDAARLRRREGIVSGAAAR